MAIPCINYDCKNFVPETEQTATRDGIKIEKSSRSANAFDAIATGTLDGLQLAVNVAAMLIAFLALLALLNAILALPSTYLNLWLGLALPVLSLDYIFSLLVRHLPISRLYRRRYLGSRQVVGYQGSRQ